MSKNPKANFKANETRPLDAIPWNAGPVFTGSDKRKLELAIRRFWDNCQLRYRRGRKVRTTQPRRLPAQIDVFSVMEAMSKRKRKA